MFQNGNHLKPFPVKVQKKTSVQMKIFIDVQSVVNVILSSKLSYSNEIG